MKYYRNRQNELITVHEIKFTDGWLEELNTFMSPFGYATYNKTFDGVDISNNKKWVHVKEGIHLIKTKDGIRIVPDFELIGDF